MNDLTKKIRSERRGNLSGFAARRMAGDERHRAFMDADCRENSLDADAAGQRMVEHDALFVAARFDDFGDAVSKRIICD